jgi:cellulose synthase/poly-beta-1,6-N-acetylglucosamine synthase-like glycosyltransferase
LSTGAKRQALIQQADTDYVCFVDDDDAVVDDYCTLMLAAMDSDPAPDVIGFRLRHFMDGYLQGMAIISLRCKHWMTRPTVQGVMLYDRTPNHLSPIRTSIARDVGYKSITVGEDADYSHRLYRQHGATMREKFVDSYVYDYLEISPRYKLRKVVKFYDESDRLTREGMEAAIRRGESVLIDGRLCTKLEQLDG